MEKVLFIVNPKSGKGLIKRHLFQILDVFMQNDMDVTIYVTQRRLDAYEVTLKRASEFDLVVCSGGDGTLDEVATGMMQGGHTCPVGYIPAGSTNDYAHSLRIPSNMEKAAQIIAGHQARAFDIGSFNHNYFVYVAAFGAFTEVSYSTNQDMKNALGHLAYILEGAKSLFSITAYRMKISMDDLELEGDFIYGMVTNSESVGGFKNLTGKNVQLDDGLFEVVLVRNPIDPAVWESVISGLLNGKADNDFVYFLKAGKVHIESEEPVAWTLDGENGGEHTVVDIENHKQSLCIMTNPEQCR